MSKLPNRFGVAAFAMLFTPVALAQQGLITDKTYTSPAGYQFKVVKTAFCRGTPHAIDAHEVACDTKRRTTGGREPSNSAQCFAHRALPVT